MGAVLTIRSAGFACPLFQHVSFLASTHESKPTEKKTRQTKWLQIANMPIYISYISIYIYYTCVCVCFIVFHSVSVFPGVLTSTILISYLSIGFQYFPTHAYVFFWDSQMPGARGGKDHDHRSKHAVKQKDRIFITCPSTSFQFSNHTWNF